MQGRQMVGLPLVPFLLPMRDAWLATEGKVMKQRFRGVTVEIDLLDSKGT
jgi:hypothetical protein